VCDLRELHDAIPHKKILMGSINIKEKMKSNPFWPRHVEQAWEEVVG
jgi:hypothetical protein